YPNVTLLKVYPDAIPPNAKYATYDDFQFKSGWEISPGHKVSVSTFGARDVQKYTKAVAQFENQNYGGTDMRPPIGLDREFRTDGFRYVYQPTPKFSNTFSFSKNYFREFYEVKFTNPTTAETIFGLQNVTTQNIYYMENVANLQIIKDILRIQGGGTYRERTITLKAENITQNNTQFSDTFNNLLNSSPVFRALIDGDGIRSREVGGFLEMNLDYKGFKFVPGVRSDYYNLSGQKILSPRLQSSYTFDSTKTTFQGGGGIHYNAPNGLEQISERVGNKNLRMEKAEKMAGGIIQTTMS
ncbi:MAG: hypothetical protein K8R21_11800, partial [Leptospira sp.]|nr:hypothetical protein [Leptospira sp.]